MCGLVGIAGDLGYKDEATMKRLLLLDYFRGPDSTGIAAIRDSNEVRMLKLASNPLDLFDHIKFKEVLNGLTSKAFIGHNRSATRGLVNNINAHPYQIDHIVGAHNGTLDHGSTARLETELGEKFGTDSQALFAGIAKLGLDAAIELCTEGKDSGTGAWSLVWYDDLEGSLNFLRNKHRPMWYAFDKEFKRVFWASEWPMIDAAVTLGVGTEFYTDPKGYKFWSTEENVHLKFDLALLKAGSLIRPKPVARTVAGREPVPVVYAATGHDPFNRGSSNTGHGTHTHTPQKTSTTTSHSTKGITHIHLFGDDMNPLAGFYDKERFEQLAKYGCSWCSKDVQYGDPGVTVFDRDDVLLCSECSGSEETDQVTIPASRVYVPQATLESLQ